MSPALEDGYLCQSCTSRVTEILQWKFSGGRPDFALTNSEHVVDEHCFVCSRSSNDFTLDSSRELPLFDDLLLNRFCVLPPEVAARFQMNRDFSTEMGSKLRLKQAKSWIQNCRLHQGECSSRKTRRFLPSRLVQVSQASENLSARLCETSVHTLPDNTEYLTLSHCWGPTKFLTLSASNIEEFRGGIPVEQLTKTFQDALYVTVELGYQYIWIDSLCIIQDSPEQLDWKIEAAKMGDVYSNSACTLMASASRDGTHGLLSNGSCQKLVVPRVAVPYNSLGPIARAQCARFWNSLRDPGDWRIPPYSPAPGAGPESFFLVDLDSWNSLTEGPLAKRGWVLQEELLSPRTLYFGDQIFWECNKMIASEVFPIGFPDPLHRISAPLRIKSKFGLERDIFSHLGLSRTDFFTQWTRLVEAYTKRKLSFPTDRLPAISGIATRFNDVINDSYRHGLWKRGLAQNLLWLEDPEDLRQMPPDLQQAPSWSWASSCGRVTWPHMSIYVDPGSDPNSINVVMLQWDTSSQEGRRIQAEGRPKVIKRDWLRSMNSAAEYPHNWNALFNSAGLSIAFYLSDVWTGTQLPSAADIVSSLPDQFIILPTFALRDTRGYTWGLVLVRQEDTPGPIYHRIGIFRARCTGTNNPVHFLDWRRTLDKCWYKQVQGEAGLESYTLLIG